MNDTSKDMNYKFFSSGLNGGPMFLVHKTAVLLNIAAFRTLGEPQGLKIGISEEKRLIYVYPINEFKQEDVIYIQDHNRLTSRIIISQKRDVRDKLIRMGLKKHTPGEWDGEKLVFKF